MTTTTTTNGESTPLVVTPSTNDATNTVSYGTDDATNATTTTTTVSSHASSIGMWGSMAIAVNSLTGPAMLDLPATFQRSGLIPTLGTLFFVCFLTAFCSLHMADTISKYPGNASFQKEVEFSESFRHFWGHKWFVVTQAVFFLCVSCLNISSIVDTSQVVDTFVGHWVSGGSGAILFSTTNVMEWVTWDPKVDCTHHQLKHGECLAFGTYEGQGLLLSIGYIITMLIFFPMALMDLKENAAFQIMGFVVLLLTSLQFVVEFTLSGLTWHHNISLWGTSWDTLFGVVLFNFALVICLPSWLYERHPSVSVPRVIHGSCLLSVLLYIFVGLFGAMAIHHVSDNMLESLMSGFLFGTSMQLGASLFAFMIIGLGIPLFSVLTRMNLVGSGLVSHQVGNALAVYWPWSISWMLYQGKAVTQLLSWGGVLFTSAVAFLLPLVLTLHTVLDYDTIQGSIQVYGGGASQRFLSSKRNQVVALVVLLTLAVLSVSAALVGQFYVGLETEDDGDYDDDVVVAAMASGGGDGAL